jgi:8-oxo-dGTP pyrophosphatase MutT (NUDIX family)
VPALTAEVPSPGVEVSRSRARRRRSFPASQLPGFQALLVKVNLGNLSDIETFLRQRLTGTLPGASVQLRFAPRPARKGWEPDQQPEGARQAAALILLYEGHAGPVLPLTVRRDDLPHHPGQISLPGGAVDPGEPPDRAALREAHEEIGIVPGDVRLVGSLSTLNVIVSNFVVRPFVGVIDGRPDFRLAPHEVASLVEVPLEELRDAGRLGWSRRVREGLLIDYPHFDLAGHHVWGATAMILGEFASLFDPEFAPPPFE